MTLDLKSKLEEDLEVVTNKLIRAIDKADAANAIVSKLTQEQFALQSALDIMNGKPAPSQTLTLGHKEARALPWEPISAPAQVVDGIIVEPGFKIGKDEQGNSTLIPVGLNEPSNDVPPPPLPTMVIEDFAPDLPEAL